MTFGFLSKKRSKGHLHTSSLSGSHVILRWGLKMLQSFITRREIKIEIIWNYERQNCKMKTNFLDETVEPNTCPPLNFPGTWLNELLYLNSVFCYWTLKKNLKEKVGIIKFCLVSLKYVLYLPPLPFSNCHCLCSSLIIFLLNFTM